MFQSEKETLAAAAAQEKSTAQDARKKSSLFAQQQLQQVGRGSRSQFEFQQVQLKRTPKAKKEEKAAEDRPELKHLAPEVAVEERRGTVVLEVPSRRDTTFLSPEYDPREGEQMRSISPSMIRVFPLTGRPLHWPSTSLDPASGHSSPFLNFLKI